MTSAPDTQDLLPLVGAAQRAAGVLAARHRGDADGVQALLRSFPDQQALAGGALLLADLALRLLSSETGQSVEECVRRLTVDLEHAVSTQPRLSG